MKNFLKNNLLQKISSNGHKGDEKRKRKEEKDPLKPKQPLISFFAVTDEQCFGDFKDSGKQMEYHE